MVAEMVGQMVVKLAAMLVEMKVAAMADNWAEQ